MATNRSTLVARSGLVSAVSVFSQEQQQEQERSA